MSFFERFPRFPFCCFVVDLRTGAIVIAAILILNYAGDLITSLASNYGTLWGVLLCVFGLVLALYLLFGALKEKAKWIEIYLWGKIIFLVYELIVIVISFFNVPLAALWRLIIWCLEIYFWLCVNSYFLDLNSGIVTSSTTRTVTTVITA